MPVGNTAEYVLLNVVGVLVFVNAHVFIARRDLFRYFGVFQDLYRIVFEIREIHLVFRAFFFGVRFCDLSDYLREFFYVRSDLFAVFSPLIGSIRGEFLYAAALSFEFIYKTLLRASQFFIPHSGESRIDACFGSDLFDRFFAHCAPDRKRKIDLCRCRDEFLSVLSESFFARFGNKIYTDFVVGIEPFIFAQSFRDNVSGAPYIFKGLFAVVNEILRRRVSVSVSAESLVQPLFSVRLRFEKIVHSFYLGAKIPVPSESKLERRHQRIRLFSVLFQHGVYGFIQHAFLFFGFENGIGRVYPRFLEKLLDDISAK